MENSLISLKELAKYIGVSKATIYRYVKRKKIPAIKIGRLWKFRTERIDAWLNMQERKTRS